MVATPRTTIPEGEQPEIEPADQTVTRASPRDTRAATIEVMEHAIRLLKLASRELSEADAAALEWLYERASLDAERRRLLDESETKMRALEDAQMRAEDEARLRQTRLAPFRPMRSVLGSLQFMVGCALAGVVLTGSVVGHDVHGSDPGYVGGALGFLAGGGVWAMRGM